MLPELSRTRTMFAVWPGVIVTLPGSPKIYRRLRRRRPTLDRSIRVWNRVIRRASGHVVVRGADDKEIIDRKRNRGAVVIRRGPRAGRRRRVVDVAVAAAVAVELACVT